MSNWYLWNRSVRLFLCVILFASATVVASPQLISNRSSAAKEDGTMETHSLMLYPNLPSAIVAGDVFNEFSPQPNTQLALNLDDLGIQSQTSKGDPELQKRLDKRSAMLKWHQYFALATGVAMAMALSTSSGTEGGSENKSSRQTHANWGMATGALYFTSASLAIFAPNAPGPKVSSGRTKIHRYLAFIHFPAMVATMIYGIQAKKKMDNNESNSNGKVAAANVAAAAFYTSLAVMVIPFGGNK